ncbi:MAG: hypothetical protein HOP23_05895 [Methylococcaceae bacterium]|nr:hypothetical protein [Methylococcaceae bacterium]
MSRPRTEKHLTKHWECIGRLKEKSHGIGQHYHFELQTDASGTIATALTWTKSAIEESELGLRPVFHHKEESADGHLFITILAYPFVQIIRRRLKESGIDLSWNGIRRIKAGQCRVTASFRRTDGRALPVRKATRGARAVGYLSSPKPGFRPRRGVQDDRVIN